MAGQFITIEGQDGAGKSTNISVILESLQKAGIDFVQTREPGGTELGEALRDLLLQDKDKRIGNMAELLMIFAARAQHLQDVIEPALESGKWVVCDRFTEATYAYQGGGREIKSSSIEALENLVQGKRRPNLTILLDVPESVGAQRAMSRSDPDRFETQAASFKQRVRASYFEQLERHPHRIKLVDASQPLEQVKSQVQALITEHIKQHHG